MSSIKSKPTNIQLRPATLSDAHQMCTLSIAAYKPNPVPKFLYPKSDLYPQDQFRGQKQSTVRTILSPANLVMVAYLKDNPSKIVGYASSSRIGDDTGAQEFRQSKSLLSRLITSVVFNLFSIWYAVSNKIWKNRAASQENMQVFMNGGKMDSSKYWDGEKFPARKNRWYVNTLTVHPEYQGRGVGRVLMNDVLERAQRERVPVGLAASPEGEFLYRKLGFEYLGDFSMRVDNVLEGDKPGGGHFLWLPEGVDRSE
ncbi:GCN5-related N-acetyltransferase protein [Rutstroemia sp. NJR-2017a BVV2]|nr:GCN5-related N-acetyltransferase protein [Rutstroemia sp. NJR-2017a BVV2]